MMRETRFITCFAALALVGACERDTPVDSPVADTAYVNGRIYTVNSAHPWANALAKLQTAP